MKNHYFWSVLICISFVFSHFSLSNEYAAGAHERVIDHLSNQGFNHLTVTQLNQNMCGDTVLSFDQVSCRYEINRCRVVYKEALAGESKKSCSFWFRIESFHLGWKARIELEKGQIVDQSNVEWGMTDVVPCISKLAIEQEQVFGKSLRRTLKPNDALCLHDLEESKDVKKNNMVKLISRSAGFDLVLSAKSLQEGNIGEVIKVRIPGSANVLLATIIGKQQVELMQ
ncbi:flagellar basal body P-ring formation chaperone FlgA [Vibrio sp. Of14-4]|nr:flagellar basal body P-ring formation chaperone FlgA [Vibrio sp. Of14-4]